MQFNTQEDRIATIKKACEELGKIYGDMKFQEHMLVEYKLSFVPNAPSVVVQVTNAEPAKPVVEEPKAKAPTKAKVKAEAAPAPAPVVEAPAPAPVVEAPAPVVEAPASDCPIKTASELREVMLKRFNESGRTAEVQSALKAALLEATGSEKVLEVKPELIAAGYNAIMAVTI